VRIQPSGHEFSVTADERVLDGALREGIAFPYGCRNGACGSCKGRVVSGDIHYPDGMPHGLSALEADKGFALFCQAQALSDLNIELREFAAGEMEVRTFPCRVARKERLADDVMAVFLKLPDTQRMQFLAGQYIDIVLRDGRRRAFSLANAPHEDDFLELHVRHVPGGEFSEFVFERMQEKAVLRIRGPLGSFYLRPESQQPIIFLVGGTGFAPVKGMVEHALFKGLDRPMHLYRGVRARRDLYMEERISQWQAENDKLSYIPVLSEPADGDNWQGRTGFVHQAVLEDFDDLSGFDVYASGPPVMVNAARDPFIRQGLDPAHLYSDAFEFAFETGHNT